MSGEHTHVGLPNYDQHMIDCSKEHAQGFGDDYMHKHFAECLEDDPNAIMFDEKKTDLKMFKIWMALLMLVICFTGLIPKAWKGCSRSENALSLLNCFSAGLFLGMALMHMMPEGVEIYDSWAK